MASRNRVLGRLRESALERELRADVVRLEAQLEHVTSHDALTGLATRAAFQEALRRAVAGPRPQARGVALLMIDLDAFKAVNDTHGPAVGDDLLRAMARRMRSVVGDGDVVGRLGGDEFAVLLDDSDVRSASELGETLALRLAEPIRVDDIEIASAVSIGIHLAGRDEGAHDVALRADAALRAAKAAGGGCERFDPARHHPFVERHQIELELRTAAARDQLVLHYQPVIELATREIVGAEALIRWDHPRRGFLHPNAFMDIAEESGAIVDVGRWVLRRACEDARSWQDRIPDAAGVGVAVNVSRRQLRNPTIVDDVAEALAASGLSPGSLTVEITETALMTDTDAMVVLLDAFHRLGVVLAMDDFGTGYSSLAQLRTLPIDVLKIDKAFVDGIAREEEEWALAAAIVRMAASLEKGTVSEGVEHPSQLAHLRALGCQRAQGYLFLPPLPPAEFERVLRSQGRLAPGVSMAPLPDGVRPGSS